MTPVEYLKSNLQSLFIDDSGHYKKLFYKASEAEREQNMNLLINFQQYLCEGEYITDYEWDFEHMAIKFLNNKK